MVRWNKVFREFWANKSRSLLVVLSIAVGVAAIGIVLGTQVSLASEIPAIYSATNPASAALTTDPFDDDLLRLIRKLPGVAQAEGRTVQAVRLQTGPKTWQTLNLYAYPDYTRIQVNKVFPQSGAWPPPERELLIERASLALTGANVGDVITVQTPDGSTRQLRIAGLAHDINEPSGEFTNQVNGYVTPATLEWLGFSRTYNELLVVAGGEQADAALFKATAVAVRERVEKTGRTVYWTTVRDPSQHWFQQYLAPMTAVLGALGALALLLSCFLVVNTISALLAQQTRQIGIMKAVGARRGQLVALYAVLVMLFGLAALLLALPLSRYGAQASIGILCGFINFDSPAFTYPRHVLLIQAVFSLLIPPLVCLWPIFSGTRISVREAIAYSGLGEARFGTGWIDRLVARLKALPRPLLLSLRNTFRKKGRLALTLVTLTLGSAIFIGVMNVQSSLFTTLDEALQYYNFDILVFFERPYRSESIQAATAQVSGVERSETWGVVNTHRLRPDGTESDSILLVAPPTGTQMIQPVLLEGRWLVPEDENAVVINTDVLRENPDLAIGSQIDLRIEGEDVPWVVVGIVKSVMIGPWAYTNYPYFAYRLNKAGLVSAVYITTQSHDAPSVAGVAARLEEQYRSTSLNVSSTALVSDLRNSAILQFNVIILFLVLMSALIALIGGLGLAGTMSLNIIERSREIGVMRAIGARDGALLQIVVVEGAVIGLLSWLGGAIAAFPLGRLLSDLVGMNFLQTPLEYVYSVEGTFLWLGIVLGLSTAASTLPALRATRISVREVLAYE